MSVGLHKQRVLVVAAHPDDEMLGCGGTLARLCAAGSHVSILLLPCGSHYCKLSRLTLDLGDLPAALLGTVMLHQF